MLKIDYSAHCTFQVLSHEAGFVRKQQIEGTKPHIWITGTLSFLLNEKSLRLNVTFSASSQLTDCFYGYIMSISGLIFQSYSRAFKSLESMGPTGNKDETMVCIVYC